MDHKGWWVLGPTKSNATLSPGHTINESAWAMRLGSIWVSLGQMTRLNSAPHTPSAC